MNILKDCNFGCKVLAFTILPLGAGVIALALYLGAYASIVTFAIAGGAFT